jgi:hypothetical protein
LELASEVEFMNQFRPKRCQIIFLNDIFFDKIESILADLAALKSHETDFYKLVIDTFQVKFCSRKFQPKMFYKIDS